MASKKRDTEEFKTQALEFCATQKPIAEVTQDLCVSKDIFYARRRKVISPRKQLCSRGKGAVGDEEEAQELARLRREVTKLRIDNDILRKPGFTWRSSSIFALVKSSDGRSLTI